MQFFSNKKSRPEWAALLGGSSLLLIACLLPLRAGAQANGSELAKKPTIQKPLLKSPPKSSVKIGRDPMQPIPAATQTTPQPASAKPVPKPAPKPTPKPAAKAQPPAKPGAKPVTTSKTVQQAVKPGAGVAVGIAAGKTGGQRPVAKKPRPSYVRPVKMVVLDAVDNGNYISTLTDDGRFIYLHVNPDTRLREGEALLQAADVKEGMEISCWGAWNPTEPEVFDARGVVVTGHLDDYALRLKINAACQKTVRPRVPEAPAPVAPAPVPAPPAPKPAEPKPAEPKPGDPKPAEPTAPKPGEPKPGEPTPGTPQPAPPGDAPKPR